MGAQEYFVVRRASGRAGTACALMLLVAGCNNQSDMASKKAGSLPKPEVSVVMLHPQSIAITTELSGRTTASLTAEVRPQVNGIIRLGCSRRAVRWPSRRSVSDRSGELSGCLRQRRRCETKGRGGRSNAGAKVERYGTLVKQNAVSKQNYDDAVATLAQAKADVASNQASVETARINLAYTKNHRPDKRAHRQVVADAGAWSPGARRPS